MEAVAGLLERGGMRSSFGESFPEVFDLEDLKVEVMSSFFVRGLRGCVFVSELVHKLKGHNKERG